MFDVSLHSAGQHAFSPTDMTLCAGVVCLALLAFLGDPARPEAGPMSLTAHWACTRRRTCFLNTRGLSSLKVSSSSSSSVRNPKAFPTGSVPAELLKAVLFPSWLHRDRSKPGVGAPTMQAALSKLSSSLVRQWVLKIFRMIRSTQRSPVFWHSAQAAYVSKHNGKAWTEGERVVMVMCPFGRAFHRSVLQRGQAAKPTRLFLVDFLAASLEEEEKRQF